MKWSKAEIGKEFARRANEFHPKVEPDNIRLWGLFKWGSVSRCIKAGEIKPNLGYTKESKTVWCRPSKAFYNKWVAPLMNINAAKTPIT